MADVKKVYETNDCSPTVFQINRKKMKTSTDEMIILEMQVKIIIDVPKIYE